MERKYISADRLDEDDFAPPKSRVIYGQESMSVVFDIDEEDEEIERLQNDIGKKRKNQEENIEMEDNSNDMIQKKIKIDFINES